MGDTGLNHPEPSTTNAVRGGGLAYGRSRLVELPVVLDPRGSLTALEGGGEYVPFDIARVYYTYQIPGGATRGGHAHRECEVFVIAMSGSFSVTVHDGEMQATVTLEGARQGLYLPKMVWRELGDFSADAVCMVLASEHYREADYIRDFESFLEEAGE
jgi:dTDP-4-dehydrorhamnose 3,5-epimerase-like enzyme